MSDSGKSLRSGRRMSWSDSLYSYGIALLAVAIAFGLGLALEPLLRQTPTTLFFVAVMVSAWCSGLGPGLLATVLSTLAINYYFIAPHHAWRITEPDSFLRLGVFAMASLLVSGLNEARRRALWREHRLRLASEEAQRDVQATKEHLETVLSSINDGFFVLDRQWRYTFVNDRNCEIIGMSRGEMLGKRVWDLFPDVVGTEVYEQFQRAMAEQHPIQFEYFYPTWNRWFEYRIYPSPDSLTVLVADICDRKQIEIALRQSEEKLRLATEGANLGMWHWDVESDTLVWTDQAKAMFGLPVDVEMSMLVFLNAVHPDDRSLIQTVVADLQVGQLHTETEYRTLWPDGTIRWILAKGDSTYSAEGALLSTRGVLMDITDRKRAEAALRQSEERLRVSQELSLDAFTILNSVRDDAGTIIDFEWTYVNPRAAEVLQRSVDELVGSRLLEVLPGNQSNSDLFACYVRVVESGEPHDLELSYNADGIAGWFRNMAVKLDDGIAVFFSDITNRKHIEETLRQREAELRLVTNTVPALISFVDAEQRYRFNNDRYEEWFGHSTADLHGKTLREVVGEAAYAVIRPYVEQVLAGQEVTYESQIPYRTGGTRYISATYVPRYSTEGGVKGFVALINDVSDRKQAEIALRQSEERYRYLVEVTPQLVWTADAQGRNDYVNQQLCDYVGLPASQLLDLDWQTLIHPEDVQVIHQRWIESVRTGTPYEAEYRLRRADGLYRWHLVRAIALRDEQERVTQWIGISIDIHDKQELDEQRSRLLYQAQAAQEEAERANQIKDEFLAILSHELRSPLNPILGWSKLLQTGKLDAQASQRALQTIERNAMLQTRLIDDLLDVSRILRGKMALRVQPVHLVGVVEAAVETVQPAADAKAIALRITHTDRELDGETGGIQVLGDPARVQQIIWNLLSNAVKFTPQGGAVEIRLAQVSTYAQLQVSDTGKGISPDFLPYVFDYFRQEDGTTTRKFGGLGLGLAIVRHLTELHGGTVKADSPGEGLGATFTVRLPLLKHESPDMPKPLTSTTGLDGFALARVRVLIVDDDADARDLLFAILDQAGAKVCAAASATEALRVMHVFQPDVLVSDIGMSGMDGYDLIRQVRQHASDGRKAIPAIALTAYAGEVDQQQALAAGFQRHMAKPVDPKQLVGAIASLVIQVEPSLQS